MTKRNHTKRALFASALSMLLCVTMLVGASFAWFTDTETTAVNTIQSGTIDIRLEDPYTGESLEGKTLQWLVDGEPAENVLWEPGCTYYTQPVRITNYSNLSFYMEAVIGGFNGDLELLNALEFKIVHAYACLPESMGGLGKTFDECSGRRYVYAGTGTAFTGEGKNGDNLIADYYGLQADWSDELNDWNNDGIVADDEYGPGVGEGKPLYDLCIIARMKEDAGNEYQGMTLTGASLVVRATQSPSEEDSYTSQYDADAEYADVIIAQSSDELTAALATAGANISLRSDSTYVLPETVADGITIDGNGATITIADTGSYDRLSGDITITNAVIDGTNISTSGNISLVDCVVTGNIQDAVPSGCVSFTNCVFENAVHFASGDGALVAGSNLIATNCTFKKNATISCFEEATFTACKFEGSNWAGTNMITYVPTTFVSCEFANATGVRAAAGMTADDFTFVNCSTTVTNLSN